MLWDFIYYWRYPKYKTKTRHKYRAILFTIGAIQRSKWWHRHKCHGILFTIGGI